MRLSTFLCSRTCAAALIGLAALPAFSLDSVVVNAPGASDGLLKSLESASLMKRQLAEQEATIKAAEPHWYTPWRRKARPVELPSNTDTLASARAEYRRLLTVLYEEGRYNGTVSVRIDGREAADISPIDPPAEIRNVVITVDQGRKFRFSQADIGPLAPDTELPEEYAKGEVAQSGVILRTARQATTAWQDSGHAKVFLARENITANHATNSVAAELVLAPGPRLRFGDLIVSGNERMRTERIVAIAGLPGGEVYSPEELNDAAERLRRTGVFRSVSMNEAEDVRPGVLLDIYTEVLEEKPRRFGFGAELTSTEGLRVNAFWMHRNLFGGGENLRFDLDIENIGATEADNGTDYIGSVAFTRPATFHPDVDFTLQAYVEHEDDPGYIATTAEIGTGVTYHYSKELLLNASLNYRASKVEDAFGKRDYSMISLPLKATWDRRDDLLDPTGGFYIDTTITPFAGIKDMDNGAQWLLDGRAYYGFGEDRNTVLAGRIQFGSLLGPEIAEAPQDFLFFAGGGGSVRGQPYQSLGAGEYDDTIYGGRSYAALSGEIRSYVRGNFGLVGFYDAGYVGAEEFYDGGGTWMSGAGLGIRYRTGMGPIRVDFATPVSGGPDDADPLQLYIGIGQAF
ncbi:autotransporter assembly complex protein TamA [Tropicimonas sp.]|uniref:autotransporter assembly complex protein TamA n=1 Tax=Tropicimonas sp. TaxID=2067044 RepID=UPI003A89A793